MTSPPLDSAWLAASASHLKESGSCSIETDGSISFPTTLHNLSGSIKAMTGMLWQLNQMSSLSASGCSAKENGPERGCNPPPALTTTLRSSAMTNPRGITPEVLRQLLSYDPQTGLLTWKERGEDICPSARARKSWNTKFAGKVAGKIDRGGYVEIGLLGSTTRAHRVIIALVTGEWPDQPIDHINGLKCDNRLFNLRTVTPRENNQNQSARLGGGWGHGIRQRDGKWLAAIKNIDGVQVHLGTFGNLREAQIARKAAERALGFHPNHGRDRELENGR